LRGFVGGSVIQDDEFEIPEGLIEDAMNALLEEIFTIVDRCDNGDFGHGST
jgi:hypothetical protein